MKGKSAAQAKDELEKSGISADQVKQLLPHKVFEGNRPTNSLLVKSVTPFTLGAMIGTFYKKQKTIHVFNAACTKAL